MTIWSSEIKELETLYTSIKGQFPDLEKELEKLIKADDENMVLLYSRRCLEVIVTYLCECELKRPRKTEPLKGIIDKLNREEKVPSYIITSMQSLNSMSTYGAHPKEFDPEQVKPVLNNLTTIIKWYLKYKDTRTISKPAATEAAAAAAEAAAERYGSEVRNDSTEGSSIPKKRLILLLSGLTLVVVILVVVLFVFNIIGGERQIKELEKSIAVLPFVNDSQDEENTYFINGIMEEVLNNLQKIKDLRVISRTSVEQYRDPTKSIPEIAKELDVNYLVEGSGQKYGNAIRLRVQLLVITDKERHMWGESYEQEIEETKDIFRIQSQIAQSIAEELKAIITPREKQLIEKTLTSSLTAYDFFLRGREEHIRYRIDKNNMIFERAGNNMVALEKAEKYYHQALEYDPTYAQAFSGLAMAYWDRHYWDTYFAGNFLDSVLIFSDIALSFDNQLAEAYSLKGDYHRENGNYKQALEEYNKALNINPNYWQAYAGKGDLYYWHLRDYVKSLENLHIAVKLNHDPELPAILRALAWGYFSFEFYDKAKYYCQEALKLDGDSAEYFWELTLLEIFKNNISKAIEFAEYGYAIDSNNTTILGILGSCNMSLGQYKKALKYYQKYVARLEDLKSLSINDSHRVGYCYWKNGFTKEAEYYFNLQKRYCEESIKLNREYARNATAYYDLAGVYAFMGEKEKAYENLRLYNNQIGDSENSALVWYLKTDPLFDSMRNEPEFQEIVRDVEAKYQAEHERVRKWLEEQGML